MIAAPLRRFRRCPAMAPESRVSRDPFPEPFSKGKKNAKKKDKKRNPDKKEIP